MIRSTPRRLFGLLMVGAVILAGAAVLLPQAQAGSTVVPASGPRGVTVHGTFRGETVDNQTMLFQSQLNGEPTLMFTIGLDSVLELARSYQETSWNESNVAHVAAVTTVLSRTHASSSFDPVEIAAAQSAIWHLTDGFELDEADTRNDPQVIKRYHDLVNIAISEPSDTSASTTLDVTPQHQVVAARNDAIIRIASNSSETFALETNGQQVSVHPTINGACDTSRTISTAPANSQVCVHSDTARDGVSVSIRSSATQLAGGRIFSKTGRQRLITARQSTSQNVRFATIDFARNGAPTVQLGCPAATITPNQPFDIEAIAGDPEGSALHYQWNLDGVAIPGAVASHFHGALAQDHTLSVTVTDAQGVTSTATMPCQAVRPDSSPATNLTPTVEFECPNDLVFDTNARFEAIGADGNQDAVSYFWSINGVPVSQQHSSTLLAMVHQHDEISVQVSDGQSVSPTTRRTCEGREPNRAPDVSLGCPTGLIYGTTSRFVANGSDPDGDLELSYSWFINGEPTPTGGGPRFDVALTPSDVVSVTVTDSHGSSSEPHSVTCAGTQRPVVTLRCPTGSDLLTATVVDSRDEKFDFVWQRDGSTVPNQSGNTLTLDSPGSLISVVATDPAGMSSLPATSRCQPVAPPAVTVSCPVGWVAGSQATFIASLGAQSDETVRYDWNLNDAPLPNAHGSVYRGVVGLEDRLTVTATDALGNAASASPACSPVQRPTVTISCPSAPPEAPRELRAVLSAEATTSLSFFWWIDGELVVGQHSDTISVTPSKISNVSVEAVTSTGATSKRATAGCNGAAVIEKPQVAQLDLWATQVARAVSQASARQLAFTGTKPINIALLALACCALGFVVTRRRHAPRPGRPYVDREAFEEMIEQIRSN